MAIFLVKIDDEILAKAEGTRHLDPPDCYNEVSYWLNLAISHALGLTDPVCEIMEIK